MHKHSYKEQEKQRREQEILQKAGQLLVEHGYANLNMDELADMVGISKPTLYQHFKSKEDLISQVVIHSFDAMAEHFATAPKGTPIEQLEDVFRWIVSTRYAHSHVFASADADTFWMLMRNNPTLAAHRERSFVSLCQLIEEAKAEGQLAQDIPTRIIARSMFCLMNVFKDPSMLSEITGTEAQREKAIDTLWQIFLHGVTAQSIGQHSTPSVTEDKA